MTTIAGSYQDEIKKLRDRNDFLEEENRQLKKGFERSLEIIDFCIPETRLTYTECRILTALIQADFITRTAIYESCYPGVILDDGPELKIIDVYICKLRRKLRPHGIEIGTVWGRGYSMMSADRMKLKDFALQAVTHLGLAAA